MNHVMLSCPLDFCAAAASSQLKRDYLSSDSNLITHAPKNLKV